MYVGRLHKMMNVKVKARGYYMSLLFFTQNLVTDRRLGEDVNLRTSGRVSPLLSFGDSEMMMVMMMMMMVMMAIIY